MVVAGPPGVTDRILRLLRLLGRILLLWRVAGTGVGAAVLVRVCHTMGVSGAGSWGIVERSKECEPADVADGVRGV